MDHPLSTWVSFQGIEIIAGKASTYFPLEEAAWQVSVKRKFPLTYYPLSAGV